MARPFPIVLLHGFTGWGRDELAGFKYWGGLSDLEASLRAAGHDAHTVAVGPVSSNWDRACEAYAYIKGGRVDYGKAHAERFGHARYGRKHEGLYPEWGTAKGGGVRKIHLVAHSLGGQTAKVLVHLLNQGAREEVEADGDGASPLFRGGRDWVASVTTLATPHNGTTLATRVTDFLPFAQQLVLGLVALAGADSAQPLLYDFKLDQFGLKRRTLESFDDYVQRVVDSEVWETRDTAAWDLSPEGARELNERFRGAQDNVYYFTWSALATFRGFLSGQHYPRKDIFPLFRPFASAMGKFVRREAGPGEVAVDRTWWPNDGVVNTVSMAGPDTDEVVKAGGEDRKGVWTSMGVKDGWDHIDIIGIGDVGKGGPFLLEWADKLKGLPE